MCISNKKCTVLIQARLTQIENNIFLIENSLLIDFVEDFCCTKLITISFDTAIGCIKIFKFINSDTTLQFLTFKILFHIESEPRDIQKYYIQDIEFISLKKKWPCTEINTLILFLLFE